MARKRDSKGRFKSEDDGLLPDFRSWTLPKLAGMRNLYERNAEQNIDLSRAKGGVGENKFDDRARSWRKKQTEAIMEILRRLTKVHLTRSKTARIADDSKDAKLTTNPRKWIRNKSRYDYPGVDTKDD